MGGNYAAAISDRAEAYFNADYSYRSKYNSTYNLAADAAIAGFGVANARIGVRQSSGLWDFSFFMRNVFDKNYVSNINPGAFNTGQNSGSPGDPRTYGISMRTSL